MHKKILIDILNSTVEHYQKFKHRNYLTVVSSQLCTKKRPQSALSERSNLKIHWKVHSQNTLYPTSWLVSKGGFNEYCFPTWKVCPGLVRDLYVLYVIVVVWPLVYGQNHINFDLSRYSIHTKTLCLQDFIIQKESNTYVHTQILYGGWYDKFVCKNENTYLFLG